eukprot:m51a1_g5297 hypothetical protein (196) ;mRNA; r:228486-229238
MQTTCSSPSSTRTPTTRTLPSPHCIAGSLTGSSRVVLANGAAKPSPAYVLCVVRCPLPCAATLACDLPGGALVAPWQPVLLPGASSAGGPGAGDNWFPACEVAPTRLVGCSALYDLVLDTDEPVLVGDGGAALATLGQEARAHPYLGSCAVLRDIGKMPGWPLGRVQIDPACWLRDPETDLVCGIKLQPAGTALP